MISNLLKKVEFHLSSFRPYVPQFKYQQDLLVKQRENAALISMGFAESGLFGGIFSFECSM